MQMTAANRVGCACAWLGVTRTIAQKVAICLSSVFATDHHLLRRPPCRSTSSETLSAPACAGPPPNRPGSTLASTATANSRPHRLRLKQRRPLTRVFILGLGAAVAGGLGYYLYNSNDATNALKSGAQVAKVKTNTAPTKEDYIKVGLIFYVFFCGTLSYHLPAGLQQDRRAHRRRRRIRR